MEQAFEERLQESLTQWSEIDQITLERQRKDKRLISEFCAMNNKADIIRILTLLIKYGGLPEHDREVVETFERNYPKSLTTKMIAEFNDVRDIYSEYLESGGIDNE